MSDRTRATLLMLLSSLSFACMGASVKMSGEIPLFQKVFMRDIVVVLVSLAILWRRRVNPFGKKENRRQLALRGLSGFIGVVLYFYSLGHLFLADSSILNKLSPFFTTLFAVLLLKEKISRIQIPALLLALSGGMLVLKPGFSLTFLPALAGFAGAIVAGFSYAMVISLTDKEDPYVVVFYFSVTSVIGSLPIMLFTGTLPSWHIWVSLVATGIFATGGQIAMTFSYKYAKASEVSIYSYSLLIFSGILGFILWREIPDCLSFIGAGLIISAGMIIFIARKVKTFSQPH